MFGLVIRMDIPTKYILIGFQSSMGRYIEERGKLMEEGILSNLELRISLTIKFIKYLHTTSN